MSREIDYKLLICGNSGVGKTYIERHFFWGMSFKEIKELSIKPTKDVFKFSEKPFKLGRMTFNVVDTGGQNLLRAKLHTDMGELAWSEVDVCIYVIDLCTEILKYKDLKVEKGKESDQYLWNILEDARQELKRVIISIRKYNKKARLLILFHKWDLLKILSNTVQESWKNWIIKHLKEIEHKETLNVLHNKDKKIEFLGFHKSSCKDPTCRTAVRLSLPRQEQLQSILSDFSENCRELGAKQVYITALNEDGLEIESTQYPKDMDTTIYYENVIRHCYPA